VTDFREVPPRRVGDDVVEEVVETPPVGDQVVRTTRTTTDPLAPPRVSTTTETVTDTPRPVRRRWWRRYRVPAEPVSVATEYYAAPSYTTDPALAQFFRIMWFALGVLEALLGLRFLLALFGANPRNEFASLVYGVTAPFVLPFRTLFPTPAVQGSVFEFYTLIAMAVYFLLWWGIVRFIEIATNRRVDV
jgi:hypothetical protein